jgi:cytoskeletal protein CcmA (bactofilin family)
MLQSAEPKYSPSTAPANIYTPVKPVASSLDQATIGRTLVVKGEVAGAESLFIDGRVEGSINFSGHRVTIGRNGNVAANITAKEVIIMGKVQGNIDASERLDIRNEGQLVGDVITHRISVEEGAVLKGGVEVRAHEKADKAKVDKAETKDQKIQTQPESHHPAQNLTTQSQPAPSQIKPAEASKAMAASAGKI